MKLTRRTALKSGLVVGGLALGSKLARADSSSQATYYNQFAPYYPGKEPLGSEQMRITFLGSWYAERVVQSCNSIFVELGNGDNFVFDFGPGVLVKYNSMGIPQSSLNKIFLTHLHADHMTEVGMLYGFGSSYKRMQPLYVWGQDRSGVKDPAGNTYNDGIQDYCAHLREAFRWHTESQAFLPTQLASWTPPSWAPPDLVSTLDLVPFVLDWKQFPGPAYDYNKVKITHFPSVHCRAGSMAYKLVWNGLSMIFTGDTKPNYYLINQANGVDVLIHEMTTQPDVWVEHLTGLTPNDGDAWTTALLQCTEVQESSHTVDKAYGYVLNQIAKHPSKAPRLAVATHFPSEDDTIATSLDNVRLWYPNGDVVVATDLMVITVDKQKIDVRMAVIPDDAWPLAVQNPQGAPATPKYPTDTYQLDPTELANTIDASVYNAR
jgi:ribonuclease Z